MCTESIALCESCGFHRHLHYQLCMAWIWSFREIKWAFKTPLDTIPKASSCPFLDGEVKREILPGRCPNRQCHGHDIKVQQDKDNTANGKMDTRTDAEKIDALRIKLGFRQMRPQGFQEPLEVGRPHQRKLPVIVMDFKPEQGSGWGRVRPSQEPSTGVEGDSSEGRPTPSSSPAAAVPIRRQRKLNGPMMMPH